MPERRFEFIPLWGIPVFFVYAMRRVDCLSCGVRVESIPWAEGKNHLTTSYAWFLARWGKRMSWKEVAGAFRTSWENVFRSAEMAVRWGREHMSLEGIEAIGVDEIQWSKGHKYLTLVYQLYAGRKRLLWIGRERKVKTLLGFFRWLGKARAAPGPSAPTAGMTLRAINDSWQAGAGDLGARREPSLIRLVPRERVS